MDLFSKALRMALRLNQPPVQGVILALFLRVKQRGGEAPTPYLTDRLTINHH
jgi:hypothetical protein